MLGRLIFFILTVFIFVNTDQSEASTYITKKSDTSKIIEKIEKEYAAGKISKSKCTKKKSKALKLGKVSETICDNVEVKNVKKETKKEKKVEYIKKKENKKKKAKKEFLKKTKDLSKKAKSWITKKIKKEKYYNSIEKLPDSDIYFTSIDDDGNVFVGYLNQDLDSKTIKADYKDFKKGNKGKVFLVDGKIICNIYSEIDGNIKEGKSYQGDMVIKCDDKTAYIGVFYLQGDMGFGTAVSSKGTKLDFKISTYRKQSILAVNKKQKQKKELVAQNKEDETKDTIPPIIFVHYKSDTVSSDDQKELKMVSQTVTYEIKGRVVDIGGSVEELTLQVKDKKIILDDKGKFTIKRRSQKNEEIILTASDGSNTTDFPIIVSISTDMITTDEKYYALVIGNNNYSTACSGECWPDLDTAINDANVIAEVLERKYNFEVTKLINKNYRETRKTLFTIREKLKPNENLLIYYAGHGQIDLKENSGYLIPVDGEMDNNLNWINNDEIIRNLKATEAKHVLVMLDSCFSGSLLRGSEKINKIKVNPNSFKRGQALKARLIITSGGNEPVIDGVGGKHSLFAKKFIDVLENKNEIYFSDGAINVSRLFWEIREYVQNNTPASPPQTPEFSQIYATGHDGGEFHFVSKE